MTEQFLVCGVTGKRILTKSAAPAETYMHCVQPNDCHKTDISVESDLRENYVRK